MGDPLKAVGFQGAGQLPAETPPAQPAPVESGTPAQPKYITQEEADRIAKDAEERAFRRAQGLVERTNSKVLQKVQSDLKAIQQAVELQRKAGFEITPEQEEKLKSQVIQKAFTEMEPEAAPPPAPAPEPAAQPATAQPQEQLDPVSAEARTMIEKAGITFEENDPELKLFVTGPGVTVLEYLTSVQAAIDAKLARTSVPAGARAPAAPASALPGNPIANMTDPRELYARAFNRR